SAKGLPGPLNIPCRVFVAVHDQPTGRADVGTHAQALGHTFPTTATVLAGIGRWAGGTATTRRPAHAALASRMVRNCVHPASLMRLARWWLRTMLATCKS